MNEKPGSKLPFSKDTIDSLSQLGERLGPDTLVFTVVVIGMFSALIFGAHAGYTVSAGIFVIIAWLVNKAINAYLISDKAEKRLKTIKETKGREFLGRNSKYLPKPSDDG